MGRLRKKRAAPAMNADEHGGSVVIATFLGAMMSGCISQPAAVEPYSMPLAAAGDPVRGREVFVSREGGHCVLCHSAPGVPIAGNVGPAMDGVGSRFSVAQLRLRVADITQVHRDTVMPTFHRTEGLERVAPELRGKPALDAQQLEDVVAYLDTLK
jgi:sulfur-oxidizing protein SoxX